MLSVTVYLALAVACYWPLWWNGPTTHAVLAGDQFQTTWYLAWTPFAIVHGHNPFFSNFQNYPYGVNLLANTSTMLLGLLAAPITLLFNASASYTTLLTLALACSATAAYFVARRFTTWRPAAFAAGLLYGFSPYEIGQGEGHLHLTFVPLPPLMLLVLYDLATGRSRRPWRAGVVLGLLATAQFFIASEVLADTAVIGGVGLLVGAAAGWRRLPALAARVAPPLVLAGAVAGVLLGYPVWFALRGPQHITGAVQLVPQAYRGDLLGPIVPDTFQRLAPSSLVAVGNHFANSGVENGAYIGLPLLLVLGLAVVVLWRRPLVRLLAVIGVVAFVLSLGSSLVVKSAPSATPSGLPLPERLLAKFPLMANVIPVRFALYYVLCAALLLALLLDHLHTGGRRPRGHRRRHPNLVPAAVAAFALVPLVPNVPYSGVGAVGIPTFFTSAAIRAIPPGSPTLVYPYPTYSAPNPVVWQADTFMPVRMPGGIGLVPDVTGHLAFSPVMEFDRVTVVGEVLTDLFNGHPPRPTPAVRAAVLTELRRWDVRHVVAVPAFAAVPAIVMPYLEWLFGRRVRTVEGTALWVAPFSRGPTPAPVAAPAPPPAPAPA